VTGRVLIAGIGNIFLSDDGFGVEVAHHLTRRTWPEGVKAADFGIRGLHLAYEILDGYDGLVLVDAMPGGEKPGTLSVIEPDLESLEEAWGEALLDAHSMSPAVVLGTLRRLGGTVRRLVVVACEPASVEEGIGLSPEVAASVEPAARLCEEVVSEMYESLGKEPAA
jgi:hydrogenase maturation protease